MILKTLKTKAKAILGFQPVSAKRQYLNQPLTVVIFLRGGADGLSMVAPYGDDSYYRNRVLTAIPPPSSGSSKKLINLDGFFGLHPSLAPLYSLYCAGQLGFVHACGSGDRTLSHFAASNTVERGLYEGQGDTSGWLSRFLDASTGNAEPGIRAVSISAMLPASLDGSSCAIAIQSLDDLSLHNPFDSERFDVRFLLNQMYGGKDLISDAAAQTLDMIDVLQRSPKDGSPAANGYGGDVLSRNLRQVAELSRCDAGLAVACIDQTGYDTHVVQGAAEGNLAQCLSTLAAAIKSFVADLGEDKWKRTRIIVMSEFGRRVRENDGGGTDHGHGNVMMVLGGSAISGGAVHGEWQPLSASGLDEDGNLKAFTDYRNVLLEVMTTQIGLDAAKPVFPGLTYRPTGLIHV